MIIWFVISVVMIWFTIRLMKNQFKITKPGIGALSIWGLLIFYVGFSSISFLAPNPFMVAKEEVQMLGNWELEQIQFSHGHYQYSPFGSTVEAELSIQTAKETISAYIELSHSLLSGWVVDDFREARIQHNK